jgi:hypothetical protein
VSGPATATTTSLPEADLTTIRWRLEQLRAARHPSGVVALAARPVWTGPPVIELADGTQAAIRLGTSVLAIRDALIARPNYDWVVVLTDIRASELPTGVLDHLSGNRLIELDPWPALLSLFRANRQEFTLLAPAGRGSSSRLARAALREFGSESGIGAPPPAPGGVLTNDHIFASLADRALNIGGEVSAHQIALWSMDDQRAQSYPTWTGSADPELAERLMSWLGSKIGRLGDVFIAVLRSAGPADLVALGLVAALLDDTGATATVFPASGEVLIRARTLLEVRLNGHQLTEQQLIAWGNAATLAVAGGSISDDVLRRAEFLVREMGAAGLVGRSDVLPAGLEPRIGRVAAALTAAGSSPSDAQRSAVENAWADVLSHRESRAESPSPPRDVQVAAAVVRLWRWTSQTPDLPAGLADWINYYRLELAWVDAAVNDAFTGADDLALARVADTLVTTARARRGEQDRIFARLLAAAGTHRAAGADAPLYIEDVLNRVVAPLTAKQPSALGEDIRSPVLLVVADGMSAAVSNEVVADALRQHRPQWQECRLTSIDAAAALAALPTLTEFSRCSLLSGGLQRGTAAHEQRGFSRWLTSQGIPPQGQVLFHKGDLDAVSRGSALAAAVRAAVDDTKHRPVVACVLNDIDDALDRSDPIGTAWASTYFKHLDPLLKAAASVGRTAVLVSDHGHVPERREQPSAQRGQQVSARYRSADGVEEATLPADEVLAAGPRVLTEDHRAVLAVDEQLRYTGLKAGYHGGASPAEAVIPISILVNGALPAHLGLEAIPTTVPAWWDRQPDRPELAHSDSDPTGSRSPVRRKPTRPAPQTETLFDTEGSAAAYGASEVSHGQSGDDPVDQLLRSSLFTQQFQTYGRNLSKRHLAALVRETIAAGGVLPAITAAHLLGVKTTRVSGALSVVAQVLNTDSVEVLTISGTELQLRHALMFEQFGVTGPGAR